MADIRVNALPALSSVAAEDILHILDASTTDDVDSQTTVDAVADWIIANKSVRITGIDDVPGLRAALDGKADIVHTHTVAQVIGLQEDLDAKTDVTQAQIIGRNIVLNGKSINVPSTIGGLQDDRIPSTVVVGEYLQFGTTGGGINNITGDDLKGNLALNLVDNTTDISKPVSTAQQSALDLKVDTSTYNTGQAAQDTNIATNASDIATNVSAIALNTQKVSFDAVSSAKLDGIEALADVTDTENVWGSLGISGSGSTGQYLTQRGVFVGAPNVSVNKSQIDAAIGASPNGNTTLFYNQAGAFTAPEGGDEVTKQAIDNAIGVFPTGDSAQFYNEQGNFVDAVYDSIEDAPIIRNRTIESIVLSGTRSNVQARLTGVSELSTITMQNTFDSSPTQYTTTFTSPNTTFTPSLVFPAGSQGRQLSLTEADGTLHRFCYLVNGNFRLLAGGLTGTVRLGPVAVATTATVTAAVTVPDQTAGQTITLAGDETGTFSVGDFISPQANNFGAYRGIFIDSITFDGTNTVIVGPSNGATTFNTTSVLRNAGPATEIQGTIPTFSGDPDTANTVYSSSIPATEFTVLGVNTSAHLIQVANAYAALETAITTDGVVTDNGDGTSSITIDYNTETNIDSSFTVTGGLNNMVSIVNVDGTIGPLSPATTITVIDPEATEVASFTSSAADTSVNNVDAIAAQIVTAVNNNTETPIDFTAEYDSATNTLVLTATEAGNTNPWTIVFNNNGTTGVNAGDLGYTSSQTGELINQIETLLVNRDGISYLNVDTQDETIEISGDSCSIITDSAFVLSHNVFNDVPFASVPGTTTFNLRSSDTDFLINKQTSGDAFRYDAGTDTLTTEAVNVVGFGGGADGLSITDTVNLNLLEGTTVLSTVILPSSSGTTVIVGTANEIINTVSGDTNTLSLAPAITDSITANTAKTGITTAQAAAIISNTGKTGITVEQSNAIIANTAKVSNINILPLDNTFTGVNTFNSTSTNGGVRVNRITGVGDADTYIDLTNTAGTTFMRADAFDMFGDSSFSFRFSLTNNVLFASPTFTVLNSGREDRSLIVRKQTTGDALTYTASSDVMTIGADVLTIDSTTINGLPSKADALSISGQVLSLLDGTTVLDTVTLPSGGTATTVQGTSGQIGVNTVGNTATVSLDTAITSAITANTSKVGITTAQATAITDNTAKVSVSGLTQVGGAIIGTDSVLYYDGTVPRRKVFSSVPLSIMNNDANFITGITKANVDTAIGSGTLTTDYYASDKTWKTIPSGGTATTVLGTTGEIDVNTVGSNATVSISSTITDAIDLNTAKQSVAGLNQVGAAVLSTDSVVYYAGTALAPRRKTFSLVPLSIMNNDSGFTTNTGTVTSVTGTANQINVATGTTTPVVSLNNTITSAITANTSKTGITTAQASAITANTAKVSNVNILPLNNTFTGVNTFNNTAGGIQVDRITGIGDLDNFIDLGTANTVNISTDDCVIDVDTSIDIRNNITNSILFGSLTFTVFNSNRANKGLIVRKQTAGDAINYDAPTDTLTFGADNISGVAVSETGTWTPSWQNNGTLGTVNTTYSRVGQTVTLQGEIEIAAGTSSNGVTIATSSFPYTLSTNANIAALGTWYTSTFVFGLGSITRATAVGIVGGTGSQIQFYDTVTDAILPSTAVSGFIGFTITYITTD